MKTLITVSRAVEVEMPNGFDSMPMSDDEFIKYVVDALSPNTVVKHKRVPEDGEPFTVPTAIAGVAPVQHDVDETEIERVTRTYRATVKAKVVIIDGEVNIVNAVVIKGYFAAKLCECVNYTGLAVLNKGKWYAKHVIAKMELDDSEFEYREFIDGHLRGLAFNEITHERHDVLIDPMCSDYIH
jgi:hypothetical protein